MVQGLIMARKIVNVFHGKPSFITPQNEIESVPMTPQKEDRLRLRFKLEKGENGELEVVSTKRENSSPPRKKCISNLNY